MTELLSLNISRLPVKLRVEDYLLLDASGAFDAYRKTELIDGDVYFMNAQHRPHARVKSRLHVLLADALKRLDCGLEAVVEGSVEMPPVDVPEPDIVVTDAAEGDGLIPLRSVAMVVEVADSTLVDDLGRKAMLYGRHGIAEYWVIDVNGRRIHQMWAPQPEGYSQRSDAAFAEPVTAVTIDGLTVDTAGL